MPINNKTALLQCAICHKRLQCPWNTFSDKIRLKYCPLLDQNTETVACTKLATEERNSLAQFLKDHLN